MHVCSFDIVHTFSINHAIFLTFKTVGVQHIEIRSICIDTSDYLYMSDQVAICVLLNKKILEDPKGAN
jgi:hypothetical protein